MADITGEQVELDYDDVHDLSLKLFTFFEDHDVKPIEAFASMVMTIGRLTSDKTLTPDEEIQYIKYIGDVGKMFFTNGTVN